MINSVQFKHLKHIKEINEETHSSSFWDQIIIPAYWGMAIQNLTFTIHNHQETLILTSNCYAQELGFRSFEEAVYTKPGIDYPRLYDDSQENHFLAMDFLIKEKKPFDYFYKKKNNCELLFISTVEPVFDTKGAVIGKRELARSIQLPAHRELVETHFKRFNTNLAALKNIRPHTPKLSEQEEIILFMLISGYSQHEIGELLGYSRSNIVKIIAEKLCPKFKLTYLSTKALIDKAIFMGYAKLIPAPFLETLNKVLTQS